MSVASITQPETSLGAIAGVVLAYGFFIVMEDWHRIGEAVEVVGVGGLLEDLSLRRTVLCDVNGTQHLAPTPEAIRVDNLGG
ncbi:MAG: mechanosensitive ion channel [Chloroflexi bacterium]|nr:mechanosensitive ion channel [Chloroflexota bacterium]